MRLAVKGSSPTGVDLVKVLLGLEGRLPFERRAGDPSVLGRLISLLAPVDPDFEIVRP